MKQQKLSIIVIELDGHWDSLDGFCRMLFHSGHLLTVWTNTSVYNNIKNYPHYAGTHFVVMEGTEKRDQFLANNFSDQLKADVIFINTIHTSFIDFDSLPDDVFTILRVHNAHKQFRPLHHISIPFSLFHIRKAAYYILREIILKRHFHYLKLINRKVDYFTFLSESITTYTINNKLVEREKIMPSLPLIPWEEKTHPKSTDQIEISIIGKLERRTKDYATVAECFKLLFTSNARFAHPVRLNLVGNSSGSYGTKIVKQLKEIDHPDFLLRYFEKSVPVDEYDEILRGTHIIISPNKVENITQIYKEIYGKTKFSGAIGAIVQFHALPIVPSDFGFDSDFEAYFKKYESGRALAKLLSDLMNDFELIFGQIEDLKSFLRQKYDKEKMLSSFEEFVIKRKPIRDA